VGETGPERTGAAIAAAGLAVLVLYAAVAAAAARRRDRRPLGGGRPALDRDHPAPI
jgi:hypothetical protein